MRRGEIAELHNELENIRKKLFEADLETCSDGASAYNYRHMDSRC